MALDARTSFKSSISRDRDSSQSAQITLRAHMEGTVSADAGETDDDIANSGLIPILYDPFPDNPLLVCVRVHVNRTSPILVEWRAEYEWRTSEFPGGIDTGQVPVGWSLRRATRKTQTQIDRDITGAAIMTVTKESPNPPINDELCDVAYIFSASGIVWNANFLETYEDAINNDEFMDADIGRLKIDDIQADVTFTQGEPPRANVQITILAGRSPPSTNLFEWTGSAWQAASQPAAYYTWHKRWRAEGFKKISGGNIVDAIIAGEEAVPKLHHPVTGALITSAADACWYTNRTKPMMSFNTLFGVT